MMNHPLRSSQLVDERVVTIASVRYAFATLNSRMEKPEFLFFKFPKNKKTPVPMSVEF